MTALLITGATGFIGGALTRLALDQGLSVAALVRAGSEAKLQPHPKLHIVEGDLAEPPYDTLRALAPAVCVHAAWIATPSVYLKSPKNEDYQRWTQDFVRALPELGVRRFVGLGSCIEYVVTGRPLAENDPLAPDSPYARAKAATGQFLADFRPPQPWSWTWARVFYPYGPGEPAAKLCSAVIHKLNQKQIVELRTPHSLKDYIYIDDLAAALLLLSQSDTTGPINLGTGDAVAVGDLVDHIADLLGKPQLIRRGEAQPDPLDQVVADTTRLHSLGLRPQVPLREGLRRLIAHLGRTA